MRVDIDTGPVDCERARGPLRVLVSGLVLGQPMGGVRRHNAELLPRAARLLAEEGGGLAVMEGRVAAAFDLPAPIERLTSAAPAGPPLLRALREGPALELHLADARTAGRPFDLVHSAHLPAPRGLSAPFSLTVHDLRRLQPAGAWSPRRFLARRVIARAMGSAAAVIAVSEHVAGELAERFDLPAGRRFVVPNAADHLRCLAREPAPDAPLLCVGHLEPRKNQELLLRALALAPDLPDLELAGASKGSERARLGALAAELGVADRVRFPGAFAEADLPRLYARAACVVLPSRVEGFGIPALEALRAGAPLAVSAAGALPEVAGPGVPSFSPDDPGTCVAAIRAALATGPVQLRAGVEWAARFSWESSARRLVEAWRAAASV